MKRVLAAVFVVCIMVGFLTVVGVATEEVPAKSAVLMEVSTGKILYEQNAHQPLPPASVTKVMTMLLVMEAIDSGKIKLDDMVTVSERAASMGNKMFSII